MSVDPLDKEIKQLDTEQFKKMLVVATKKLKEAEDEINDLNIFPVPDGDTGTNMYLTLSNAVKEIKELEDDSIEAVADKLAMGALMGARGNSGVILSQLLKGLAIGIDHAQVLTAQSLADGLEKAADKAYQAVMKPVEGTILTVAREVGEKAQELSSEVNIVELLVEVVKQAKESVAKTPQLLDALKEAGVVDAGGKGYQIFLQGLLEGITATVEDIFDINETEESMLADKEVSTSQSDFGYCTEFFIKNAKIGDDEFKEIIASYGDSLVVVQAADIVKVHIHSDHPGNVLEEALKFGELDKIKIDNMTKQHRERIKNELKEDEEDKEIVKKDDLKNIEILSVVAGEGLKKIFENLGVGYVLQGGQSMNPSTQDLLKGIEEIKSDNVIILPNNKNVISAAKQVKDLAEKKIEVIPTKTVPQGVAAMMMYNPEGSIEQVSEDMKEELEFVKTGEITYAVRDTNIKDLRISKGDILGLSEGKIELVANNYNQATVDLIEMMAEDGDSLITIYAGEDVKEADKKLLEGKLKEKYSDFDIEIYEGEQPIYYYIISVE